MTRASAAHCAADFKRSVNTMKISMQLHVRSSHCRISAVSILALGLFWQALPAKAFNPGKPIPFEKAVSAADVVFKGKVVRVTDVGSSAPGFERHSYSRVYDTTFRVISVLKGEDQPKEIDFRHYGEGTKKRMSGTGMKLFAFDPGKTYVVFAKTRHPQPGLQQVSLTRTGDRCIETANADPLPKELGVREALWMELNTMLKDVDPLRVQSAVHSLIQRSGGSDWWQGIEDYSPDTVATVLLPLLQHPAERVVIAVVKTFGRDSPLQDSWGVIAWLASLPDNNMPKAIGRKRLRENRMASAHWQPLLELAQTTADAAVKKAAIRALSQVKRTELKEPITAWAQDQDPSVRATATLLLGQFDEVDAKDLLGTLVQDDDAGVRRCAAYAIGMGRFASLLPVLEGLLQDSNRSIRIAATQSIVSFPMSVSGDLIKRNVNNKYVGGVFVNLLAEGNPEAYLPDLKRMVDERIKVRGWSGTVVNFASWDIIFGYITKQDRRDFASGKWDAYLDTLAEASFHGSSDPRDFYAFLLTLGMQERAKAFRAGLNGRYDYYLDEVDKKLLGDKTPDTIRGSE